MKDIRKNKNFLYTQSSLNLFNECPHKFKTRYFDGIYWNEDDDMLESFKKGEMYHLIAERYFKGIEVESFLEGEMKKKFLELKKAFPLKDNWKYFSEYEIKQNKDGIRLLGRYDLIIVKPQNKIQIVDFKTNKRELEEEKLLNSLQTKIYLYLLWENYKLLQLNIRKIKEITMNYYQYNFPNNKITIIYNQSLHEENKKDLKKLIETVDEYDFQIPLKSKLKKCFKCEMKKNCKFY